MEPNFSDPFVEERMTLLQAEASWTPDAAQALRRYRTAAAGRRRRAWIRTWAAGGAAAACAGLLAFPMTRVLAKRCVDACVAETAIVRQYFGFTAAGPAESRRFAPGFTLTDASGNAVRLSDFKGKVVLLNFWATWCPPCRMEIPWFVEFQRRYDAAGLVVLGVSLDEEGWTAVRPCLAKMEVNYRMMVGDDALTREFGGVETLPSTFLIDREGRIAVSHAGLADRASMEDRIRALLAE